SSFLESKSLPQPCRRGARLGRKNDLHNVTPYGVMSLLVEATGSVSRRGWRCGRQRVRGPKALNHTQLNLRDWGSDERRTVMAKVIFGNHSAVVVPRKDRDSIRAF